MYALGARELTPGNQKDKNGQVIKAFKQKLRDRIPSYEEFEAGMLDIRISNENTMQRQLVRYLLRRVDEHLRTGVRPDYEQMTVEHLASQNPSGAAEASEDVIGMLGNLLLVPQELNEGLKNLPVKEKLKKLRAADCPLDSGLKRATNWTDEAIRSRTRAIAKLLYEKILKV